MRVVARVWSRAAGRCEFFGCNELVWKDSLTNQDVHHGKIAHIVAFSPDGPRGDPLLSPKLAKEPDNLMLVCSKHHELIDDKRKEAKYPVKLLTDYKARHEARIERLTGIFENRKSVPLLVAIPVGAHADPIRLDDVTAAMAASDLYPQLEEQITIDMLGMTGRDRDAAFFDEARKRLADEYLRGSSALRSRMPSGQLSIFAFGPMPLLIDLGRTIGDKLYADVFNLHRSPKGWSWPNDTPAPLGIKLRGFESKALKGTEVALAISITSEVQVSSLHAALPSKLPVVQVRVKNPALDTVRSKAHVEEFAVSVRRAMEALHRQGVTRIHVFPAVPVALAVTFGRSLLPKLHAPLELYDYNRDAGGWRFAFSID
jgi:hypothetical protein